MDTAEQKGKKRKKAVKAKRDDTQAETNNNTAAIERPTGNAPKVDLKSSPARMSPIPKLRRVVTRAFSRRLAAAGEPTDHLSLSRVKDPGPTRGNKKLKVKEPADVHSTSDSEPEVVTHKHKVKKNKKKVVQEEQTSHPGSSGSSKVQDKAKAEFGVPKATLAPEEPSLTQSPPTKKIKKDKKKKKVAEEAINPDPVQPKHSELTVPAPAPEPEAKKKPKEIYPQVVEAAVIGPSLPVKTHTKHVKTDIPVEKANNVEVLKSKFGTEGMKEVAGPSIAQIGVDKVDVIALSTEAEVPLQPLQRGSLATSTKHDSGQAIPSSTVAPLASATTAVPIQLMDLQKPGPVIRTPTTSKILDKASRPKHTSPAHPQSPSLMLRNSPLETLDEEEAQDPDQFHDPEAEVLTFDLDKTYVIQTHGEEVEADQGSDDISASPMDNYNITLFHEYDENMTHREGKKISKWAQSTEFVTEQLFRTQPNLMRILLGRRSEDPIFPPVDIRKKLFPGIVAPPPPRPRQ